MHISFVLITRLFINSERIKLRIDNFISRKRYVVFASTVIDFTIATVLHRSIGK